MIVTYGRNDREKLAGLLAAGEQTHLDYKATIDLTERRDKLNLVKDIVAMSNRPGGGYIIIGVSDGGVPCIFAGPFDRASFDGANLGQMVRGFIEGQIEVHSQVHELEEGHEVVLLLVAGHRDPQAVLVGGHLDAVELVRTLGVGSKVCSIS